MSSHSPREWRAKLRAALRQTALWAELPATVWQQPWVVDCRSVGTARAALKYLAPYIFRVALSNNRIVQLADDQVTFRYTDRESGQTVSCTLPVQEFIRRFLQHILPKGFVKVRYYGLFRVGMRRSLTRLRSQLHLLQHIAVQITPAPAARDGSTRVVYCPSCGQPMLLKLLRPVRSRGPPAAQRTGQTDTIRCRAAVGGGWSQDGVCRSSSSRPHSSGMAQSRLNLRA